MINDDFPHLSRTFYGTDMLPNLFPFFNAYHHFVHFHHLNLLVIFDREVFLFFALQRVKTDVPKDASRDKSMKTIQHLKLRYYQLEQFSHNQK